MKLKVFDKLMLVLFMLALIAASIGLIVLCWGGVASITISNYVFNVFDYFPNKIIFSVASLLVIFLSGRILFVRQKHEEEQHRQAPGILIRMGDNGASYITNTALEGMILKNVRSNAKVRDCACSIIPNKEFISISIKTTFTADVNVPETTQEIQANLKESIESLTGINVRDVQVLVESANVTLSNAKNNSKPRVG